jgi:hypothetical protein
MLVMSDRIGRSDARRGPALPPESADPPVTPGPEEETKMHPRLFRLLEKLQRIDERLRLAQRRRAADRSEIVRLRGLRLKAKRLIHLFTLRAARA